MAAGWIAIALLPVANILPIGIIAAERTLYLPSVGFALLVALWIAALGRKTQRPRLAGALALLLILVYAGLSARVAWQWRSPHSMWEATVRAHPSSPKAHAAYGMEILNRARREEPSSLEAGMQAAQRQFRRALELNPRSADARMGLAIVALMAEDCPEAERQLREAEVLRPGEPIIAELRRACPRAP